jgi:D-3-phosphoglycerate dehydrogenase / 2-oxoglutarate reductase
MGKADCLAWRSRPQILMLIGTRHNVGMNIVILDDYQDVVRKLELRAKLENYPAKVYTNTVKGIGQLSVRLRDADVIVLIRERTALNAALIEKLPRLKMIAQTGKCGQPH